MGVHHLLRHKEPVLLFIACAAVGAVSYITVYYIPIYFQFTQGDDAIHSAVRLLPFIFLLITTIPASGAAMSRLGYYKPWYLAGSIIALIPAILMGSLPSFQPRSSPPHTSAKTIYGLEILLGLGAGAYTQDSFAVIQAVIPPPEASNGLTLMLLAQLSGMTLGLSLSGAIFVNRV
ncbi:uncharacterized protein BO80DRAFT_443649 [Aspergillus ibericus CBS 121593]|uniref:MFS general substrate transporter n=1 Tax=Aspergillus ibericus CBS 121593 TaxID=1448316 RepID=A0A395H3Z4_9EURO|nr:hypothetical protein BO80DRAFT_443649 [Aspergillus ibericus CBS 121593]RAL02340.1 hypothetical protein BO80DRAFT_443649 [Aspergillus ibericus CBS 121593]